MGVSEQDIIRAYGQGSHTLRAIRKTSLATTACGTCTFAVQKLVNELREKDKQKKKPSDILPF